MSIIDLILAIIACLCIGVIYTIFGYNVIELFTDGPNWKPWEQCVLWMFWPILIQILIVAAIVLVIFITFAICYDILRNVIKKLFKK